jgi:DNA modification methylase
MRRPDWRSADGLVSLYHARCEELLTTMEPRSIDIVATSPPYNTLQGETNAYGFRARRRHGSDRFLEKLRACGYADKLPEPIYQAWLAWVVAQLIRVTRGPTWINHKLRYRDDEAVFPVRFLNYPVWNRVIWWRRGSMAQNCRKFKPSTEEIYAFGARGFWSPEMAPLLDVWADIAPERGYEEHVCPWPPEIPLRLVKATCPPEGTVFDPFMGRATAAVACLRAGGDRRFIGCDADRRAFEAAVRYIEAEYAERKQLACTKRTPRKKSASDRS